MIEGIVFMVYANLALLTLGMRFVVLIYSPFA